MKMDSYLISRKLKSQISQNFHDMVIVTIATCVLWVGSEVDMFKICNIISLTFLISDKWCFLITGLTTTIKILQLAALIILFFQDK